jgi:hypothetical protein
LKREVSFRELMPSRAEISKKEKSFLSFQMNEVTDFGAKANGEITPRFLLYRTAENTQTFKKSAKIFDTCDFEGLDCEAHFP